MNKKDLVDIVSKKERKIEIAKIHEILDPSPDLVLFHAERSRLKPPSPSKDIRQGAKGHRRRRLGSLLFRRESIHVPASTIHIRRKKKKKRGRKISVAGASREQARKEDPDVEEDFKERRFRQPLGIRSPYFEMLFY